MPKREGIARAVVEWWSAGLRYLAFALDLMPLILFALRQRGGGIECCLLMNVGIGFDFGVSYRFLSLRNRLGVLTRNSPCGFVSFKMVEFHANFVQICAYIGL